MTNPWTPADRAALQAAKAALEHPGLAARATHLLAMPVEAGFARLPSRWRARIGKTTTAALTRALRVAVRTMAGPPDRASHDKSHMLAVAATGAAGGAFGLLALGIELPISTTIMLRSIVDIARLEGEDIDSVETALACIEVFALGSTRSKDDDTGDSAYFASRAVLARSVSEAAEFIAKKGIIEEGAPGIVRFLTAVGSRFGVSVSEKAAAMAIPILGAAGGAAVNLVFLDHFQDMAHGHFVVRRLERKYGAEVVRLAYEETDRDLPARVTGGPSCRGTRKAGCAGRT